MNVNAQRAWLKRVMIKIGLIQKRLPLPEPLQFWERFRICPKCLEKGKLTFMMEVFVKLTGGMERFMACPACGYEYYFDCFWDEEERRSYKVMKVTHITGGYITVENS